LLLFLKALKQKKENTFQNYIQDKFKKDAFGHAQLGGTAQVLAQELSNRIDVKVRAIEFSLLTTLCSTFSFKS
jgi:hypothetical protein